MNALKMMTAGYTAEYFRVLKHGEKVEADEKKMGWTEYEDGKVCEPHAYLHSVGSDSNSRRVGISIPQGIC